MRRPVRAEKVGITIDVPKKKRKVEVPPAEEPTASDQAAYEEHCKHLQKVYNSQKWTMASMATLLEETAQQRTKWIKEEGPTVINILQRFPCLREPTLVSIYAVGQWDIHNSK